jgi:hypothetical protein
MKKPFTEKEGEIMSLLVDAHNNFIELDMSHPMEKSEWVSAMHRLQDLLSARVLRRDYPETFTSITKFKTACHHLWVDTTPPLDDPELRVADQHRTYVCTRCGKSGDISNVFISEQIRGKNTQ